MAIPHGLSGCLALTNETIDAVVALTSPGAYALGTAVDVNELTISYVGRADYDINARLKDHVGRYRHFQFAYFITRLAAFEKECWLYHTFNPAGNAIHPARPGGAACACPVGGCSALFY